MSELHWKTHWLETGFVEQCISMSYNVHCAFLNFCFSVQPLNILCFKISISHFVVQCACLIYLVFQGNSLIYWVLHCAFPILCFSVQLINILCFTMCISHYVLKCAVWFSMCFSTTHSYIVFFNVHFSFSIFQCNSLTYCVL